jgi:hypothetical protein
LAPPPRMKIWLPWSELAGTPRLTVAEFQSALRQYPRSALLIACARLSMIFNYGPEADTTADEKLTAKWAPILFPPALVPRVKALAAQNRVIFFQGQLRYLAAAVIRLEQSHAEDSTFVPDAALGGLLLAAGELLYKPHVKLSDDLDVMANLIAEFLPTYEIGSITVPLMLFLRFYIFLTVIIPQLPDNLRTFDVEARFAKHFGFPLKRYYQFIFSFILHAMLERNQPEGTLIDGALRTSWFKKSKVPEGEVTKMFDTVSFSLAELPDTKAPIGYGDFEFLRDHPYFKHDSGMYCLDYEYAVAKVESAVLWRVLRNLDTAERLPYLSFWGNVFERYVSWLFDTYANKHLNVFYLSPSYEHETGRPICDAVVVCGYTAVLVEAKLATCSAVVRYSGDHQKFRQYLEDRLVTGTNRPVGVSQLVAAVEILTALPDSDKPAFLCNVRKFIPLIVTKDEIGSSWVTNMYLNARFGQKLNRRKCKPYTITPLVSISVSTLERSVAALSKHAFSDILEDRIRGDRKLGRPFEAASSYVPAGPAPGAFKHLEIMQALSSDLIADFGITDEPGPEAASSLHDKNEGP